MNMISLYESRAGINIKAYRKMTKPNIVLIGMPAVGKSTIGVLLAKRLGLCFADTDILIQAAEKRSLAQIIAQEGIQGFCQIEAAHVLALDLKSHVIATGGSVVYSHAAMSHLGRTSRIVFLHLPLPELKQRLADIQARGVIIAPGQSLKGLFAERVPLYQQYADLTIDCQGLSPDQLTERLFQRVSPPKK